MNEQKQGEAAARLEFKGRKVEFVNARPKVIHVIVENGDLEARNYLHDHNAIKRLIKGMDKDVGIKYITELTYIVVGEDDMPRLWYEWLALFKATCSEELEAILKAYEVWEEEG